MVVPFTYKEKFLSGFLTLGLLDCDKKEVSQYDYKRIQIDPNLFNDVSKNKYVNKYSFGFSESLSDWGKICYVAAFDSSNLVSYDYQREKRIAKFTTVMFEKEKATIEFYE